MNEDQQKRSIAEVAEEWLLRMEDPSPEERAEFWQWLRQSPLHVQEILRAKASHTAIAGLIRGRRFDIDTVIDQPADVRPSTLHRPVWKIAAAVAFLALLALMIVSIQAVSDRTVLTDPGEWHKTRFADGTVLQAGPRTELSTEFTDQQRTVRLVRGEAMFRVATDRERPFLVETDRATARAVGTAFAVSLLDSKGAVVTVEEGVVTVARRTHSTAADESVTLQAGQQVQVTEKSPLTIETVDVQKVLAWVNGWFVFDSETIAQAVREFNLRNRMQLEIEDEALAQLPVRGAFEAAKPHAFAAFLERRGTVSIVRDEPDTLLLVPYRRTDR